MGIRRFEASSATTMSAPRQIGIWLAVLTALVFVAQKIVNVVAKKARERFEVRE